MPPSLDSSLPSWNQRYSEPGYAYGTEPNEFLVSAVKNIPKGRILSFAEGEGRNGIFLASLGYDVAAVDSSEVGLAKAQRLAEERGVKIKTIVADLDEFPIKPESWDGIISIFCHLPVPIRARLHKRAVAGLKPGGAFVLEAFTPSQLSYATGGPKSADRLVSLDALRKELSGLDFIHAVEKEREVHEGKFHSGLSHVVQVIGIKQ